ncbi:hypothetical protein MPSEU_000666400 [Mayamaea pseudoterrestris]|nr:hypothetical protein MPSEU_000666400 [Mayamaea pseudoterrestris]
MSRRRLPGRISVEAMKNETTLNGDDEAATGNNNSSPNSPTHSPAPTCLPLSMQLLKFVPGMHCNCCSGNQGGNQVVFMPKTADVSGLVAAATFAQHDSKNYKKTDGDDNQDDDDKKELDVVLPKSSFAAHEYYDLQSLRLQYSAASPLVVGPMLLHKNAYHSSQMHHHVTTERLLHDYMVTCQFYNVSPNAGVTATLRFSLPCLRMTGLWGDADVLAVCELMLHHVNGPLAYLHRLDFSLASLRQRDLAGPWKHFRGSSNNRTGMGMRSHGAIALSKVLQTSKHVAQVYLQRNPIGPFGSSAIFIACSSNPNIQTLNLRRCRVGERGALAFCEWICNSEQCGLVDIDLSANFIGFKGSLAIERSLATRAEQPDLSYIHVNLEGNLVLQEIMNGVTHGLGVLMAFAGSWLLYQALYDKPSRHFVSCMVYSMALVVLYISSTLYHSFFILQHTKYIFEVLDKCAIYVLISGSYTPFLQIVLWNDPLYSVYLLTFIWVCCFLGIFVEAFFPTYHYKRFFSLAMYLGMGWSALVCLPEVARKLPEGCTNFMVLGGVGYTAGVPFFVRNHNLDHAIWHLFVLAGSLCHWCGIYFYVTDY